jgi:hypothetical protein
MAETARATGDRPKIFVSYSRRDLDFANQLVAMLEWHVGTLMATFPIYCPMAIISSPPRGF